MKKLKVIATIFFLICSVFISSNAFANCNANMCIGKITRLYISSNILYISTDGDERNLDCTAPAGVYITISTLDPNFKTFYAMMLTGMSLDSTIGFRIVNGSDPCSLHYVYLDN